MDDVHVGSPCSGLGQRPLQHLVGAGSPDRHVDSVPGFERLEKGGKIFFGDRGVEGQGAFVPPRRAILGPSAPAARRGGEQDADDERRTYRPAPKRSVYRFFHLSYSSIATRASTNVMGTLFSGVSTFLLVGTKSRIAMICWPSGLSSKS